MKRPKKVIRSTKNLLKTKGDSNISSTPIPVPQAATHPLPLFVEPMPYNGLAYNTRMEVNYIPDSQLWMCFVLEPLLIKSVGLCTTTSQEIFPSCRLIEVYVSLCCTIMKQTLYWWNPSQMLTTAAFLQHIRKNIRDLGGKGVQTKDERDGQSSNKIYKEVSNQKRMRFTTCGATQSPRQCHREGYPNI